MAIYVRNKEGVMESYKIVGLKGENGQDGASGKDGATPNITIGNVTTLEPNQQATVTREGTNENPIFNFGIPRGADGTGGNGVSIDDNTVSTDKTWSSAKIEDFVLTNDNTIWSDVNGEDLSIEHTKEGFLREVEILGNTVQDQDNLSDIKHLGELYVDDDGKPKLDSQGRKQYKIEVEYSNQMFKYNRKPIDISLAVGNIEITSIDNGWNIRSKRSGTYQCAIIKIIGLIPGTEYRLKAKARNYNNTQIDIYMNKGLQYEFKNETTNDIDINRTFTPTEKEIDMVLYITKGINATGNVDFTDFILTKKDDNVDNLKSHKTTVLTPCQLMKVGNVADRLYWDSSKGRYVVEKNISEKCKIKCTGFGNDEAGYLNYYVQYRERYSLPGFINAGYLYQYKIVSSITTGNGVGTRTNDVAISWGNNDFRLLVNKSKVANKTEGVEYFNSFNPYVYYPLQTPQLIETNITEELKLPTFINNTYISVNGGIQGSIKAKAPVDGGKVIKNLQRESIELKATNDKQDELINTTMLAADEMFMMLEPLLAETVLSTLESLRSTDKLIDMYAVMVKRGIKSEDEINEKYRDKVMERLKEQEGR